MTTFQIKFLACLAALTMAVGLALAIQTINVGTTPDDSTGDPLRTAFGKINDNFTELTDPLGTGITNIVFDDWGEAGVHTLRMTNGVLWLDTKPIGGRVVTNVQTGGVSATIIPHTNSPLGAFGYVGYQGSAITVDLSYQDYTNLMVATDAYSYTRILTNHFGYDGTGERLTNHLTGYYDVDYGIIVDGTAGIKDQELEGAVFINGTVDNYLASHCTGPGAGSNATLTCGGTIFLQAGCTLELMLKNTDASPANANIIRAWLRFGTP